MKQTILIMFALFVAISAQAQGSFKIGANVGAALSDAGDVADITLGIDAYYMFNKKDAWLNFGPTVGYQHFFTDFQEDLGDAQFLPVGVAGRFKAFGVLDLGADAGYAFGLSDFLDGGFYIRPVVGIDILNAVELFVSYETIFDDATWGSANVGFLIEF